MRYAGCERVFAKWATDNLDLERLKPERRPDIEKVMQWERLCDWVFPLNKSVSSMEPSTEKPLYPGVLVDAWVEQEKIGTAALKHERLIIVAAWGLFIASILRTVLSPN